jgi:hypothetical protein
MAAIRSLEIPSLIGTMRITTARRAKSLGENVKRLYLKIPKGDEATV